MDSHFNRVYVVVVAVPVAVFHVVSVIVFFLLLSVCLTKLSLAGERVHVQCNNVVRFLN